MYLTVPGDGGDIGVVCLRSVVCLRIVEHQC